MTKYRYIYNGSGIMTFHDKKGNPHIVSTENREVILDEKLDILGIKREEIITVKQNKKADKGNKED